MSASIYIFGDDKPVRIHTGAEDEGCVWVRCRDCTVALQLTAAQRDALRAALDEAEQYAVDEYARVTP